MDTALEVVRLCSVFSRRGFIGASEGVVEGGLAGKAAVEGDLEYGFGGGEETIGSKGEAFLGDQRRWKAAVTCLERRPDRVLMCAQGLHEGG